MRMKELIIAEHNKRIKELDETIKEKEGHLEDIKQTAERYKELETKYTFAVEKKYSGFRATIHKKGDSVKIFSAQGKDITFPFPTIAAQAKGLSAKDFIIDCELVPYKGSKPLNRNVIAKYFGTAKSRRGLDDKGVIFFAFDCVHFGSDITGLDWIERKKILDGMRFTSNIKKTPSIVIRNRDNASQVIKLFKIM